MTALTTMPYATMHDALQRNATNHAHTRALQYLSDMYGAVAIQNIRQTDVATLFENQQPLSVWQLLYALRVMMHVNDFDEQWYQQALVDLLDTQKTNHDEFDFNDSDDDDDDDHHVTHHSCHCCYHPNS